MGSKTHGKTSWTNFIRTRNTAVSFPSEGNDKTGVDWTEPSMDRATTSLFVNIGTNDSHKLGTAWETIYVGALERLQAAWGSCSGARSGPGSTPRSRSVITAFSDPANRTTPPDWGGCGGTSRRRCMAWGCFINHPSIAGHRTMAPVIAAIKAPLWEAFGIIQCHNTAAAIAGKSGL